LYHPGNLDRKKGKEKLTSTGVGKKEKRRKRKVSLHPSTKQTTPRKREKGGKRKVV